VEEKTEIRFAEPGEYSVENSENIVKFTESISPRNVTFMGENNEVVGKLTWDDGIFKFEGEAEESARIFFDSLKLLMPESKTN